MVILATFLIREKNSGNDEVTLTRYPLVGYMVEAFENTLGELIVSLYPIGHIGECRLPKFIKRHDGVYTDINGDSLSYSLTEIMQKLGFKPKYEEKILDDTKMLSTYVWCREHDITEK